ncbi:hypothetical protein [Arthrobacter oryzae]|uniref:hypothetical protein n=1 Tax=Arthrobacter oryzae TaxID=409290 RepID=UPI00278BA117|nr:hypothetical protein [Arthrobacter oryzae]MDQ0078900.1 cyanate permease [Arthrobacter oryzae]
MDAARPPKSANKTNDGSVAVWVLVALVLVSINLRPAVTPFRSLISATASGMTRCEHSC